jgi:hypothetical protein
VLVTGAFLAEEPTGPAGTWPGLALVLAVYVPLTVAAMYPTAALLGMSFGFLKTAILKLAAITVFTLSLNQVADWWGYPVVGWIVAVAVSLYLFSYAFDLDFVETLLAAAAISIIRFALGMGVAFLLDLLEITT